MSTTKPEPATAGIDSKQTTVGSVFVSNYPPYSTWNDDAVPDVHRSLSEKPHPDATLGLYMHIPFCRKRCKFCYFRVYTDKNSSEIDTYLNALAKEIELYSEQPAIAGRPLRFVYFGGGTPSYISVKHLTTLVDRVKKVMPWDAAEEVAFECEPGTLTQKKLEAIKSIGVTRLSLGVENLNDEILAENGRAHLSKEVYRIAPWIQELAFEQVNIDLISGMIGETWESWRDTVQKTIELDPDSITVYQLELPFNTVYSKDILGGDSLPVADWKLKREWHQYAFEQFAKSDYEVSSAYTVLKKDKPCQFVYRDAVWQGSDMIGTGVASFSHLSGIHFQNAPSWGDYLGNLDEDNLPIYRALQPTETERLTREMILQLKLGKIRPSYFKAKFDADILTQYADGYEKLQNDGMLRMNVDADEIQLTQRGLLQVDSLLPTFYAPEYQNTRYT
ncbi:MAG: coproporphyrinogen-III oxidase family protein [Candidatus Poribacteria bacterium]|nr:coproporphyrinogen-III oxidase family protein [Candidatus Poribacteria bacterium]